MKLSFGPLEQLDRGIESQRNGNKRGFGCVTRSSQMLVVTKRDYLFVAINRGKSHAYAKQSN